MNAPLDVIRRPSVCPHDCPSVCALDVEVIGGARIGRIHGAADQRYTRGRRLRQGRALRRAHPSPGSADPAAAPRRPEGLRPVPPIAWDDALDRRRGAFPRCRAPLRRRKRLALFLRGHDGPRDARRARAPDARQALFALLRLDLRRHRLAGLSRRNRAHGRRRSARDGQVRLRRHLGHERRRDAGQCDDPRDAGAKGARREDRRHRHLRHRDDAPGGSGAASASPARTARSPAPSCTSLFRDGSPTAPISRATPTRRASWRRISRLARSALGERDHRPKRRSDRGLRGAGRAHEAHVLPSRLRLFAPAQRRGEHARGALHPGRHGRLGARGRRRAFIPTAASSSSTRP